ncbi:zona pellucida sperm-binding protein 3-like [Seriola lalandi dorsalis]|uniref:zona pellucida sperm-binding protein 3-like n=1 Tax=Seriola lalandi dorsalis TaxID=1841481 RepID=UPI000C6F66D6|nr:zona pellucida sperm-binding protein 3-like [Seriola lalandi dorsalis]
MLADLPPIMNVPRVQVFCDESRLTVLVDKRSYGVMLKVEEIQLGDGCYSNRERPNQFVFTYSVNECGTTQAIQNGLKAFTNLLRLNLKPLSWQQTPSTLHISCIPKRSYDNPGLFTAMAPSESFTSFDIKAMNPSWTSATESNVYERGQVVNLKVSAKTRPDQQLFIQSCFVSASPEPQTKSRHALIMNKGCTTPLGSPHPVVHFVASSRGDVVNLALNTSYLISELYIHCTVLISDQGVTIGSKSCNYNVIQSRWEELSGDFEVCECCSSRCKGPSVKHFPEAKATVSTGPLVILDKMISEPAVSGPQETTPVPLTDSMLSDAAVSDETIVSGTSVSRSKFSSPPQGVVVVSQDPVARLTLWLPGQVQDTEHSSNIGSESEDSLTVVLKASDVVSTDLSVPSTDQESHLNPPTNKINFPLPAEMTVNDLNQIDFNQTGEDLAQMQVDAAAMSQEETTDVQPIIRSKIQFSKGMDGSQTLSYEEEVVKPRQKGLHLIFLDLLRRMDKAE